MLGAGGRFIDDMDRLHPPTAVKTPELVRIWFAIEKCVFVIAIDYQVVVKGLVEKYGKRKADNEHEFRSFFDKRILQKSMSHAEAPAKRTDGGCRTLTFVGSRRFAQR